MKQIAVYPTVFNIRFLHPRYRMSLKHQLYLGFAITSQTDQKIPTFGRHHTGPNCELPLRFTQQMFKLLIHAGKVPLLNKIKQTYDHIMSSLSLQRSLRKIMSKRNGIFEPYISFTFFYSQTTPNSDPQRQTQHWMSMSPSPRPVTLQTWFRSLIETHHHPYILPCLFWPWLTGTFKQYE